MRGDEMEFGSVLDPDPWENCLSSSVVAHLAVQLHNLVGCNKNSPILPGCKVPAQYIGSQSVAQKKDKDTREGKGRRCCLDSIPSCTRYFNLDDVEEKDEQNNGYLAEWML